MKNFTDLEKKIQKKTVMELAISLKKAQTALEKMREETPIFREEGYLKAGFIALTGKEAHCSGRLELLRVEDMDITVWSIEVPFYEEVTLKHEKGAEILLYRTQDFGEVVVPKSGHKEIPEYLRDLILTVYKMEVR